MISISNYNNYIKIPRFSGNNESDAMSKGDKALNENRLSDALNEYKKAMEQNPDNAKIYKKLGKTYYNLKDYKASTENFQKYVNKVPDDVDGMIELGESLSRQGLYQQALTWFEKAYNTDSSNDLARRSILQTKNNILSVYAPERAYNEKMQYARDNLRTALNMTVKYWGSDYMSALKDVSIQFGKTAEMGGTANIAQYENAKQAITVSDSYIYASPQVIAAYVVHESLHGHDNDPYTSIREEQDAYEAATKFWIKNANGVKDPEMDYAAGLYKKSPDSLKNRVREIYKMRDPAISETSPNHPPSKGFSFVKSTNAASQSISTYNVIA